MLKGIHSIFKTRQSEQFKTFFIGQSVAIHEDYFKLGGAISRVPVYGWTIKTISGNMATIISGGVNSQKVFIDCKYLKSA